MMFARLILFTLLVVPLGAAGCSTSLPSVPVPPSQPDSALAPNSLTDSRGAPPLRAPDAEVVYVDGPRSSDGTGRYYLGREIARVMSLRGVAWLEREDREIEERPDLLVAALDLEPDDVVADIGAGTGYFAFRLAPRVPEGRVLAVDIQPEMLRILETRSEELGVTNVAPVLGTEMSPGLRPNSVDLTLIVDSYHQFSHPKEMLEAIYTATKPGGQLVIVEYRAEDPDVPIRRLHKMTEAQARLEGEAVGFELVENLDVLPQQHVLVFERPVNEE
ncbi:MAG: methyltransferase domain-containing protein [Bacteroidota bacterium]